MFPPKTKYSNIEDIIKTIGNPNLKGGVMLEKVMGPLSKGHLNLLTTNPNHNPSVTFNYFKEPEDLSKCVEGLKMTIIKLINSQSFSGSGTGTSWSGL